MNFPAFKKISIEDKSLFHAITHVLEPYSDQHFTSLFVYDTENECQFSILYGNLVIEMSHYVTGQPLITLIGTQHIDQTIAQLFCFLQATSRPQRLDLVPEACVNMLSESTRLSYSIFEDTDNVDYILSVEAIAQLSGGKFRTHRQRINQFLRENPQHSVKRIDLMDANIQKDIIDLFERWRKAKTRTHEEVTTELAALKKIIAYESHFSLINIGIYDANKMIAITINEIIENKYYVGHFGKYDQAYNGISYYAEHVTAKYMSELGCKCMNFEQDLGFLGLREFKLSWHPVQFLRKFTITPIPVAVK